MTTDYKALAKRSIKELQKKKKKAAINAIQYKVENGIKQYKTSGYRGYQT